MTTQEIADFLKDNVEPLEDELLGNGYRASVYLKDGTYLPCVMFRNPKKKIDLAIRRFKEEKSGKGIFSKSSGLGYRGIVGTFVASGNKINDYDLDRVELSPYAFPKQILNEIHGETTMAWTGFAAKMKDGKVFGFGTSFLMAFFQLPEGYNSEDITEIINHSYVLDDGTVKAHKVPFFEPPHDYERAVIFRERPFFDCYLQEL